MDEATIALTAVSGAIALIFLGLLIWGIKAGQFKNVEEAKYQVFRRQKPSSKGGEGGVVDREREVGNHAEQP